MDKTNIDKLDNAMVLSKLSNFANYCEVKTNREKLRIVIVDGVPLDFRLFTILCIVNVSGGVYSYRQQIEDDVINFWQSINYKLAPEIIATKTIELSKIFNSFDSSIYRDPDFIMTNYVLSKLNICSGGSNDTMADLYPLMNTISHQIHEYTN